MRSSIQTFPPLTGLLLGAGASYEVGMPLAARISRDLGSWLTPAKLRCFNAHWRSAGAGCPDAVIDDLANVLVQPNMHYEAILGYLETQSGRHQMREFHQGYHGLHAWLVEMVTR